VSKEVVPFGYDGNVVRRQLIKLANGGVQFVAQAVDFAIGFFQSFISRGNGRSPIGDAGSKLVAFERELVG